MDKYKNQAALTAFRTAMQSFRKWAMDVRICLLFLTVLLTIFSRTRELSQIVHDNMDCAVNGFSIFPVIYSSDIGIGRFITLFCILLLYCNAPFFDKNQQFVLARTGRRSWNAGQVLYIYISGFIFVLMLQAAAIIGCMPDVAFSVKSWGKALELLSRNYILNRLVINSTLMKQYTVMGAFVNQFLLLYLLTVFLGMLIYFCNLLFSDKSGLFAAGFVCCVSFVPSWLMDGRLIFRFSPASMAEIFYLGQTGYPSLAYAYGYLGVLNLIIRTEYSPVQLLIRIEKRGVFFGWESH